MSTAPIYTDAVEAVYHVEEGGQTFAAGCRFAEWEDIPSWTRSAEFLQDFPLNTTCITREGVVVQHTPHGVYLGTVLVVTSVGPAPYTHHYTRTRPGWPPGTWVEVDRFAPQAPPQLAEG